MHRRLIAASVVLTAIVAACGKSSAPTPARSGFLITNANVIDGSGSPPRRASVRVEGDRIAAVGNLTPRAGEPVIDAPGLTPAPGFIDTPSHADDDLFEHPDALAVVSQGITTIIGGQDGGSPIPLAGYFDRLEKSPGAVNVGMYVGHGSIRDSVMGADFKRVATPGEVDRMKEILASEMRAGAIGLSSGLEYDPGIYSDPSEVIALAKVAASFGGRYISHPERGLRVLESDRRDHHDRPRGKAARPDLPHEARHALAVGSRGQSR
jgi:N-acyl-D-amino-acid deacylase